MVYSGDLKSPAARHAGSSPASRTKLCSLSSYTGTTLNLTSPRRVKKCQEEQGYRGFKRRREHLYGDEASMVMQWTVNPPPSGTTGSIPVISTKFYVGLVR